MRRRIIGLLVSIAAALGLAPASAQELDDYPEGPEKAVILERCGLCHSLRNVRSGDYDEQGWREILFQMRNIGAALTDDDIDLLTAYLIVNSPPNPRPDALIVPGEIEIAIREWNVPTQGSMPRDVAVAPDGRVWVSGTFSSTLIELDPETGSVAEHRLRPYSAPFGVAADANGGVWFASSRRGYIARFDPAGEEIDDIPMPGGVPADPSDLALDNAGIIWFTAQNGNVVGRFDPVSRDLKFVGMPHAEATPFALAVAPDGAVFAGLRDTKSILRIDPVSLATTEFPLTGPETEPRRIAITDDGVVWYADIDRGYLGRLDPETGMVTEYPSPSGPLAEPHGIAAIGDIVWYVEAGAAPNTLVRFDPATEQFQSWSLSGYGVIRDLAVTEGGDLVFGMGTLNRVGVVEIAEPQ